MFILFGCVCDFYVSCLEKRTSTAFCSFFKAKTKKCALFTLLYLLLLWCFRISRHIINIFVFRVCIKIGIHGVFSCCFRYVLFALSLRFLSSDYHFCYIDIDRAAGSRATKTQYLQKCVLSRSTFFLFGDFVILLKIANFRVIAVFK